MPCNMYDGATSGDFALSGVQDLKREMERLTRVSCELAQIVGVLSSGVGHAPEFSPELRAWIAEHRAHDERQGRRWR